MILGVSAFFPLYPEYKCIEDGKCLAHVSKRDTDIEETLNEVVEMPTLKIKQRLPIVSQDSYSISLMILSLFF
jgi:hypothetical protein